MQIGNKDGIIHIDQIETKINYKYTLTSASNYYMSSFNSYDCYS